MYRPALWCRDKGGCPYCIQGSSAVHDTEEHTQHERDEKWTGDKKRTWNQKNYTVLFITFMSSNAVYIIYMWHTIVIQPYHCITMLMGIHYQLTTSYPCTVCTARTKRGLFIVQFHVCVCDISAWHSPAVPRLVSTAPTCGRHHPGAHSLLTTQDGRGKQQGEQTGTL